MKLDLSGTEKLDRAHLDNLNAIALEIRQPFNEMVRRLGVAHGDSLDWWVTPIA